MSEYNGNTLLKLVDINPDDLSPMMRQYYELKLTLPDTIIFYRLGDFYEMFFDDAIFVSRLLELTLTRRDCGNNMRAPMCGVPFHAYQSYAQKLVSSGNKVAICEQLEDPALAKGLVKRGIVNILTPGTATDFMGGDIEKDNNYLMSIYCVGAQFGVAVADVSTGDFEATQLTFEAGGEHLMNLMGKYRPSEILYNPAFAETNEYKVIEQGFQTSFTARQERDFASTTVDGHKIILEDIDKFHDPSMLKCASGAIIIYAEETKTNKVAYLNRIKCFKTTDTMELDYSTRVNLELTQTIRSKSRKGSLIYVMDHTKTAMGGRLLRKWIEEPLIVTSLINSRLDAVEEAYDKFMARQEIIEALTGLYDIERLAGKVSLGSCNARDLIALRNSLAKLPFLKQCASGFSKGLFRQINSLIDPLEDVHDLIDSSISEDCPLTIKDGDIIKRGFSSECDELYEIATNGRQYILQMENREKERTGIKTLKISYNKVFGYYIEVPKSQSDNVPEEYIRKQTLANNERYITPEIKELEDKIINASSKRVALEYELFNKIREAVAAKSQRIFDTAKAVALIDVVTSLAQLASEENYVRPAVDNSETIEISCGRHPVVEKMTTDASGFISNDTLLDDNKRLMVLTGPNMAGKSTYMRQVAIITLMAQIGSFVPAKSARIGIVDHIFTRIGASDDISMGQSTFMVEMREVSYILRNATRRSLLLLDEVGRGTSTYDGLSIAWAVIEYITDPNVLYSRTIFATHYHELNQLARITRGVFNNHVDVSENEDGVIFLHKIVEGGTSDSYGIEVARLAGVPGDVLTRSKAILSELERIGNFKVKGSTQIEDGVLMPSGEAMPGQESIFNPGNIVYRREDKLRSALRDIDITRLTPLEAMNILYELVNITKEEDNGKD
ncbi:DNA mismatch repair protein MutS [Ruminococcaceae bacterium YRB3002]|nr:DNA mismatch repair protein MutS [Ruminococcaceae bacterium YRB3002]